VGRPASRETGRSDVARSLVDGAGCREAIVQAIERVPSDSVGGSSEPASDPLGRTLWSGASRGYDLCRGSALGDRPPSVCLVGFRDSPGRPHRRRGPFDRPHRAALCEGRAPSTIGRIKPFTSGSRLCESGITNDTQSGSFQIRSARAPLVKSVIVGIFFWLSTSRIVMQAVGFRRS